MGRCHLARVEGLSLPFPGPLLPRLVLLALHEPGSRLGALPPPTQAAYQRRGPGGMQQGDCLKAMRTRAGAEDRCGGTECKSHHDQGLRSPRRHGGPRLFVKKRVTVRAGAQALRKAARENASLLRYIYTAVGGSDVSRPLGSF